MLDGQCMHGCTVKNGVSHGIHVPWRAPQSQLRKNVLIIVIVEVPRGVEIPRGVVEHLIFFTVWETAYVLSEQTN